MRLGDRIAMLKDGRIVQIGTGPEILRNPANEYVSSFVADVDRSRVLTAGEAMRRPRRTFSPTDSPQEVLDWLADQEFNGAYVIDRQGKILGVARDDRLAQGIARGDTDISGLLIDDYAGVTRDTPLAELAGIAALNSVPIAVVDDRNVLEGVVPRARLLAALSAEGVTVDA